MAIRDIQAFMRQRAQLYDPNLDVNPGSPFDVQVIQPLLRRLGTDPFSVDLTTFINDRIAQAYPDLATSEGDALTDLLNKPATLLFDPLVRETQRVQRNSSLQDPSTLTLEEADALGANFFSPRRTGNFARGVGRIFFTSPQNLSVSPVNFFTSKGGLRFFPQEVQSIRTEEMLLNVDAEGLYYFDVNAIAESAGSQYNIGPNQLVSVANIPAATRVRNLTRFAFGEPEESAEEYVNRVRQELTERSLVTLRGIASKLLNNFPEVRRLNVVGFNDPEMQRDVLRGGGLGELLAAGVSGTAIADTENRNFTRRFQTSEVDFELLLVGNEGSFTLTVFGAFGGVVAARDLTVREVIGATEVDLEEQVMQLGATNLRWSLRKRELTLSQIPGGILFPDSPNGTLQLPDNEVHIGGAYDVHVRGSGFDEAGLTIDNVTDDSPLLVGTQLDGTAGSADVVLQGLVFGVSYEEDDPTWVALENAAKFGYTLQILTGSEVGNYRVQAVAHAISSPVVLTLERDLAASPAGEKWQLVDEIDIDLVEPKQTRVTGADLRTVQGTNTVDTVSGVNFDAFGVAEDDVLRILGGPDAGDYTVTAPPLAPSFDKLQLDAPMTQSKSDLDFVVFRPSASGGLSLPLVRVRSVELLDAASQPLGSEIPYALPVDIQTRAFQNPARGIKHDFGDVRVGLVSQEAAGGVFTVAAGSTLQFVIEGTSHLVVLPTTNPSPAQLAADISAALLGLTGVPQIAVTVGAARVGIRPVRGGVFLTGGSARVAVFGSTEIQTTGDIRSVRALAAGGWSGLSPLIDFTTGLDAAQVLDGVNAGVYGGPLSADLDLSVTFPGTSTSTALQVVDGDTATGFVNFAPEERRRVQVGTRSIGSARMFFLAPTSLEVDQGSVFTLETATGDLRFLPDPTLSYQQIPPLPGGQQPADGSASEASSTFTSTSQNFTRSGIRAGDQLVVENIPLTGSVVLPDPVPALAGTLQKTLVFSLDGGPDRTLPFIRDDASLNEDEVSRAGVVAQINAAAGETICTLTGADSIKFTTTRDLVVRASGTANATLLGTVQGTAPAESFVTADQSNLSPHARTYVVQAVTPTTLTVTPSFPASAPFVDPVTEQTFTVRRQGVQRVTTTEMAGNEAEAGLFFFDVELVSDGVGDEYNISQGLVLRVEGARSDGYYLRAGDSNVTFSTEEQVHLVLSRTILEQGVDDDPANATQLTGQNVQITYERAPLVENVQSFVSSDVERVVCASPLSRHLIPHFVRFDVRYVGGSNEAVVVPDLEELVRGLFPYEPLESSDIQKVISGRGAVSIDNPITLIAVVHNVDRTITVARSQDSLTTGRLAAFIPDRLDVKRDVV